jgi:diacylglycerol kinase (ATP)
MPVPKLRVEPTPPYPSRQTSGFLRSFVHAWNGLIHTLVYQRNMRVHLIAAILVGLVGSGIPLGLSEKVTLLFCIMLIFFAEILNTALEQLVDLAIQQFDEKARVVKDAASAGVLVLAVGTVMVFAAILVYNWQTVVEHGAEVRRQFLLGIPLATSAGLLMMASWRKSPAVDALLFGACLLLFALTLPASKSIVFSVVTFSLLMLAEETARTRRKTARAVSIAQRT